MLVLTAIQYHPGDDPARDKILREAVQDDKTALYRAHELKDDFHTVLIFNGHKKATAARPYGDGNPALLVIHDGNVIRNNL